MNDDKVQKHNATKKTQNVIPIPKLQILLINSTVRVSPTNSRLSQKINKHLKQIKLKGVKKTNQ